MLGNEKASINWHGTDGHRRHEQPESAAKVSSTVSSATCSDQLAYTLLIGVAMMGQLLAYVPGTPQWFDRRALIARLLKLCGK